ncbi:hypothetical protein bcere0028_20920 [Bacillus cereus AH1271]|nr:hypothetical protein bcere0028_20920 [Bacillus cereus AH1271]
MQKKSHQMLKILNERKENRMYQSKQLMKALKILSTHINKM